MTDQLEEVMSRFYSDNAVVAYIMLGCEASHVDTISELVSDLPEVEDVMIVTGDTDIVVKVRFESYTHVKDFIVKKIAPLHGLQDTQTMMVVGVYKERGKKVKPE